ncbi:VOC family protein [Halobacillus shinanisalinarum]|uniref:VOC family protein n=1 Tax=Halobacillus shinanisalinarum TaxID=2932258 RepID=A0ABY4GV54_9BACI|nr:VOC family protein [Halobacillus shinanisalinarum]UOQ91785.1 VOC family protein [Halobacillus shinanisalinarum]
MTRCLLPEVHAVFVHTKDLKRSARWYSDLLDLPFEEEKVHSPVYNLPVKGGVHLTIDDHKYDSNYSFERVRTPVFNFCSKNLVESYQELVGKGVIITKEIESHGDFGWFHIQDPDEHVVMVCGTIVDRS